jgi:hypothetical protein
MARDMAGGAPVPKAFECGAPFLRHLSSAGYGVGYGFACPSHAVSVPQALGFGWGIELSGLGIPSVFRS